MSPSCQIRLKAVADLIFWLSDYLARRYHARIPTATPFGSGSFHSGLNGNQRLAGKTSHQLSNCDFRRRMPATNIVALKLKTCL